MRIGVFLADGFPPGTPLDDIVERARRAEAVGLASGWLPHVPWSLDALTAAAVAGASTSTLELGTAVVPTWSRHPYAMAQQALSTHQACGGRLALGIGPSHRDVAERWYGASYEGVVGHVADYLGVLDAGLATTGTNATGYGTPVHAANDRYAVDALLGVPGSTPDPPPVLLAALAPRMLRLAGERAAGTITWMGDERALETHVVPKLVAAAEAAGRPRPRVVAGVPVAVCEAAAGRAIAEQRWSSYTGVANYARLLEKGSAASPADVAIVGDEEAVAARLRRFEAAGATDIAAMVFAVGDDPAASVERTEKLLGSLNR